MKILSLPPEKKHFKGIGHTEKWAYVWESVSTPKIRLYSPHENPWGEGLWSICLREAKGKTDKTIYTNRLDFQLFPATSDCQKAKILWEVEKGIAHSNQETIRFYVFPFMNSQKVEVNLMISILKNS